MANASWTVQASFLSPFLEFLVRGQWTCDNHQMDAWDHIISETFLSEQKGSSPFLLRLRFRDFVYRALYVTYILLTICWLYNRGNGTLLSLTAWPFWLHSEVYLSGLLEISISSLCSAQTAQMLTAYSCNAHVPRLLHVACAVKDQRLICFCFFFSLSLSHLLFQ